MRPIQEALIARNADAAAGAAPSLRFRRGRAPEQVAAVCYRAGKRGIEFLLVKTGGGRWTFPKGGVEAGLTQAQAAAIEAYEEAGVHGHMEEAPFASYLGRKRREMRRTRNAKEMMVHAHLCKVLWCGKPEESNRNPRWFSANRAKEKLLESRSNKEGSQLAKIVESALLRVRELQNDMAGSTRAAAQDPLRRTLFEASDIRRAYGQAVETQLSGFRKKSVTRSGPPAEISVITSLRRVLQLGPRKE